MPGARELCPAKLSLSGWMIQKDLFPGPGEVGHMWGSVCLCRVFSVGFQCIGNQKMFSVGRSAKRSQTHPRNIQALN